MDYLNAFLCGGILCAVDRSSLTKRRSRRPVS